MNEGGWYVVTVMPSAVQYVNGGPYKSNHDAFAALNNGMSVRRGGSVEVTYMSAADVEKYKAMLRFPKKKVAQPAPSAERHDDE